MWTALGIRELKKKDILLNRINSRDEIEPACSRINKKNENRNAQLRGDETM